MYFCKNKINYFYQLLKFNFIYIKVIDIKRITGINKYFSILIEYVL